jgi:hypothetical protein
MLARMPLVTVGPYPLLTDMTEGYAVLKLHTPHARALDLVGDELAHGAEAARRRRRRPSSKR